VVQAVPPGMLGRVMGIQNIKGTGLDFVYRWLAWETVHGACVNLVADNPRAVEQGRQTLLGFQEFGLLSEDLVREAIASVREKPAFQAEALQAQLATILNNLDSRMALIKASLVSSAHEQQSSGFAARLLGFSEQLLDSIDAISRRRRADRIYRELVAERVSPERAAVELQMLNKRQKGGWLKQRLNRK
jgi:hypothetical protein